MGGQTDKQTNGQVNLLYRSEYNPADALSSPSFLFTKYKNFLWVCWFLCNNLTNFGYCNKNLHNPMAINLHNYFDYHVCLSIRLVSIRCSSQIFFSLKSPWKHPLTPGVVPRSWPRVPPGHTAPPEELARARRALSSTQYKCGNPNKNFVKECWII